MSSIISGSFALRLKASYGHIRDLHIRDVLIRDLYTHGVASVSRLLKIIGLFCKRALEKRRYSAKETCIFKAPTHRSHPLRDVHIRHRFRGAKIHKMLYLYRSFSANELYD